MIGRRREPGGVSLPGTLVQDATPTIEELRDGSRATPGIWARRLFLALLALFAIAALFNAFGQRQAVSRAQGSAASLTVSSPPRVRGGLLYQARIRVRAHRAIKQPQLVFDQGWFEQTTVNAIEPQPSQEQTDNGRVSLQFDALPAGHELIVWLYFQVNPTNIGRHHTNVVLEDGNTQLADVKRTQLNLP